MEQQVKKSQSLRSIPSRVANSQNQVDLTVGIVFLQESVKIEEVRPGRQRSETLSAVETDPSTLHWYTGLDSHLKELAKRVGVDRRCGYLILGPSLPINKLSLEVSGPHVGVRGAGCRGRLWPTPV